MSDFLSFRRMAMPFVIQVLFWIGVMAAIVTGVAAIGLGASHHSLREVGAGVGLLLLGPLAVRLYAELLIVIFRINETLTDLRSLATWAAERAYAETADDEVTAPSGIPVMRQDPETGQWATVYVREEDLMSPEQPPSSSD
jgi:hypothetical protein